MATAFIIYLSVMVILFYAIGIVFFLRLGVNNPQPVEVVNYNVQPTSIIIAFRNEAHQLENLVSALNNLQFKGDFEVLFCNDHSEDNGVEVIHAANPMFSYSVYSLEGNAFGKKTAIQLGLDRAKFPLVVITDADCTFQPFWLSALVDPFQDQSVGLVTGAVDLHYLSAFEKWQMMEQKVMSQAIQMSFNSNKPWMVNGANLALRKAWIDSNIFEDNLDLASGDDEYLLKGIQNKGAQLVFCEDPNSRVLTRACPDFESLLSQRHRWASKISRSGKTAKIVAVLFLLLHLWPWLLFVWGLFKPGVLIVWFLFLFLRLISDRFLFKSLITDPKDQPNLANLFVAEFWQHIYVPVVSWRVLFYNYTWKGRSSNEYRNHTT